MGRVAGKVALITGAARGQGRSHAVRLAAEGAEIVAVDLCAQTETVGYPLATPEDLATTARLVEEQDRRVLARQADVRDLAALRAVVAEAVAEFGHLDVVCANAGIATFGPAHELTERLWQEMIDVNLTGVWKTASAAIPQMIEQGTGGSIVLTSSVAGLAGMPNLAHYNAAKHGVVGLMRGLAVELAPHRIRVNTVHPTSVDTPAIDNEVVHRLFRPDLEHPGRADTEPAYRAFNALPVAWIDSVDVSNAVLFLASDESRYITGTQLPVDAGSTAPYRLPNA